MTKRILSFIVATALLLSCFVLPVVAEDEGSVTFTNSGYAQYVITDKYTANSCEYARFDTANINVTVTLPGEDTPAYTGPLSSCHITGWVVDVEEDNNTPEEHNYRIKVWNSMNPMEAFYSNSLPMEETIYDVSACEISGEFSETINLAAACYNFDSFEGLQLAITADLGDGNGQQQRTCSALSSNNMWTVDGWQVANNTWDVIERNDDQTLVVKDYTLTGRFLNKTFTYTLHVINDPSQVVLEEQGPSLYHGEDYAIANSENTVFIGDNTMKGFEFVESGNVYGRHYPYWVAKNYPNFSVVVDGMSARTSIPTTEELGVGTHTVDFYFGGSKVQGTYSYIIQPNPIKKVEIVNGLSNSFVIRGESSRTISLTGLKLKVYLDDAYAKAHNLSRNNVTFFAEDGCPALRECNLEFVGLDTDVVGKQEVNISILGVQSDKKISMNVIESPIEKFEVTKCNTLKAYVGAKIMPAQNVQEIKVTYDSDYASALGINTVMTYKADGNYGIQAFGVPGTRYAYILNWNTDPISNEYICEEPGTANFSIGITRNGGETLLCTPASYSMQIVDNPVESMAISHMPLYTEYTQGLELAGIIRDGLVVDLKDSGGNVIAQLSKANDWTYNGIRLEDDANEVLTGFNGIKPVGNYEVSLSYGSVSPQSIDIRIIANDYRDMKIISNPTVTSFSGIYKPDFLGTKIRLTKNDGSFKDYTLTADMVGDYTISNEKGLYSYRAVFYLNPSLPPLFINTLEDVYDEATDTDVTRFISNGDYVFSLGYESSIKTVFSKDNFRFTLKDLDSYRIEIPSLLFGRYSDLPSYVNISMNYKDGSKDEYDGNLIRRGNFGDGGDTYEFDGVYVTYDIGKYNLFKSTSKGLISITANIFDNQSLPLAASLCFSDMMLKIDPATGLAVASKVDVDGTINGSTISINTMDNSTLLGLNNLTTQDNTTIEIDVTGAGSGNSINTATFSDDQIRMVGAITNQNVLIDSATFDFTESQVELDQGVLSNISNKTNGSVTLSSEVGGADELDEKQKEALAKGSDVENVVDLNLSADGEEIHDLGGEAKISLNVEAPSDGEDLAAYYYNEKAAEWEPVEGSFNPKTNEFDMNTNHFSTYVIVKVPKSSSVSAEKIANTLDENSITASSILLVASVAAFVTLRKKENEE